MFDLAKKCCHANFQWKMCHGKKTAKICDRPYGLMPRRPAIKSTFMLRILRERFRGRLQWLRVCMRKYEIAWQQCLCKCWDHTKDWNANWLTSILSNTMEQIITGYNTNTKCSLPESKWKADIMNYKYQKAEIIANCKNISSYHP